MAKQRVISTHFWDDGFVSGLGPMEKLLFLYLLTNPLTTIAGCYEITVRRICFDTGIDEKTVMQIFEKFAESGRIVYRDGWILIVNFIKNQSRNPKIEKGIEEAVKCCPDWAKHRLSIAYPSLSHLNLNSNTNTKPNGVGTMKPEGESQDKETTFVIDLLDSLKNSLGVVQLPHEAAWSDAAVWAFGNSITIEDFVGCYQYLDSQSWRDSAVKANHVMENLPKYLKGKNSDTWTNG